MWFLPIISEVVREYVLTPGLYLIIEVSGKELFAFLQVIFCHEDIWADENWHLLGNKNASHWNQESWETHSCEFGHLF